MPVSQTDHKHFQPFTAWQLHLTADPKELGVQI